MKIIRTAAAAILVVAACTPAATNELDGRWRVQQIAGAALGEGVEIWIEVDEGAGTISGFTGCNPFTATVATFGDTLAITGVEEAGGECPSAAAATDEQRFLRVLPSVQRRIVRGRSLELLQAPAGSETLVRLRREDLSG